MESRPFELVADYSPAGDQPQAIEKLVEGLGEGLAHQTLLGVTGSGKSVGYDEPLLITEARAGQLCTRLVKAGPYIDGLMAAQDLEQLDPETERLVSSDRMLLSPAYDPQTGQSGWYHVAAVLRHRAPERMYRLTTRCGRHVTLTADHNLWVLRGGSCWFIRKRCLLAT